VFTFGGCIDEVTPLEETCDNPDVDNDCDGLGGEGSGPGDVDTLGDPCEGGGAGACAAGVIACDGPTLACDPVDPVAEACNALDDNCDGDPDDGFDCVRNASVSCTTSCGSTGTGVCTSECEIPAVGCTPPAESCNGDDDDCDGDADDTFACVQGEAGVACNNQCGVAGETTCSENCTLGACCAGAEVCGNGCDDDCANGPDDGCPAVLYDLNFNCTSWPHGGATLTYAWVVRSGDQAIVGSVQNHTRSGTTVAFTWTGILEAGVPYVVRFFADLNGTNDCEFASDHVWERALPTITGNTTFDFPHNTPLNDICSTFP
jgi:hypothetical protein